MRSRGLGAPFPLLLALIGTHTLAWAQAPRSPLVPAAPAGEPAEAEELPRFQVEIIAFAYNAFDPTEELFERERPLPVSGNREPEATPRAQPLSPAGLPGIDPYRRPGQAPGEIPVRSVNPGSAEGPEPERSGPLPGVAGGEPPSISERILATLNTLEEEDGRIVPGAQPPAGDGTGGQPPPALQQQLPAPEPAQARSPFPLRFLGSEELELADAHARLNRLDAYTVLAHGGWVQEGLPEERARPVDLSLLGAFNPAGTVQLHLSRFLHVTVALDYYAGGRAPVTGAPGLGTYNQMLREFSLPPVFELRATRRTRSGELHYFDHPAFGLLVMVRPAPDAAEEPQNPNDPSSPPLGPAA